MQLSASCPDLRMDVPLRLMESRSRSRQGSSRKLRAGKARCVRQVYIWSWQLGKPTGEPVVIRGMAKPGLPAQQQQHMEQFYFTDVDLFLIGEEQEKKDV
ncbi:hypothetical protein XENORESO_018120 [Xenotaenia resolanae]|uniref:Uncharacterized protein n=1 Tax=Xenotaenia resolanae TaxID=208358 RepID=A0ABV0WTK5_9TELE